MGLIELLVIEFRGNRFKGEIIPALREVIDRGLIRIIDLVFVKKDRYGDVSAFEMSDMEDEIVELFTQITSEISGMLSQNDITKIASKIRKNSSVGILLIEHIWAIPLRDAILNARGRLVMDTLIAPKLAEKAMATAGTE
jgi:hypothetical protein